MIDLNERCYPGVSNRRVQEDHYAAYEFAAEYGRGKRVGDIACGTGYGSRILKDAGATQVVGVDLDQTTIEQARKSFPDVTFQVADAVTTGLESDSLDVVVSLQTWHHLDRYADFPAEMSRILKKGGRLIVSVPNEKVLYLNPFHRSFLTPFYRVDFDRSKMESYLRPYFGEISWYGQRFVKRRYTNSFAKFILFIGSSVNPWLRAKVQKAFALADGPEVKPLRHENARYIIAVCTKT